MPSHALVSRLHGSCSWLSPGSNRGAHPICYGDDQDRLLFLDTLAEACEKTDWQVHAWCLMSNRCS